MTTDSLIKSLLEGKVDLTSGYENVAVHAVDLPPDGAKVSYHSTENCNQIDMIFNERVAIVHQWFDGTDTPESWAISLKNHPPMTYCQLAADAIHKNCSFGILLDESDLGGSRDETDHNHLLN